MLALHRSGQRAAVIGVVERWRADGTPSVAARLAEVECLEALGLLDRAWSRLEAVPEAQAPRVQRLRLAARLLARREGGERARAALHALRAVSPKEPAVGEIEALLEAPPRPPDLPPALAPLEVQLEAASNLLAAGAHVRARRLLDTLAWQHAGNARVEELLWAVRGEWALPPAEAARLVAHHGGTPPTTSAPLDDDLDLEGADATQITRFALPDESPADPAEDGAERTQVVRVVGGGSSGSHAALAPELAPMPELEDEDDGVVLVARRTHRPATTRRPLPSPKAEPRAVEEEIPDLDDEGAIEAVSDLELEALASGRQAPVTPPAPGTAPPHEGSLLPLVVVGVLAVAVAAAGLLVVAWSVAG